MIRLLVYTLQKKLVGLEVEEVAFPGSSGRFAVLANHGRLVSTLVPGNITYKMAEGAGRPISVIRGVVKVENNEVVALVEEQEEQPEEDTQV